MKQGKTKVKEVTKYKDSQGEHLVTKGKLIFIPTYDEPSKLTWSHRPIIISETEKIEVGDNYINIKDNYMNKCESQDHADKLNYTGNNRKILALPEHFSPKHLQAIIDGKMKDGDEVYVECKENILFATNAFSSDITLISEGLIDTVLRATVIKLTDGHIKLFPVRQSEINWIPYSKETADAITKEGRGFVRELQHAVSSCQSVEEAAREWCLISGYNAEDMIHNVRVPEYTRVYKVFIAGAEWAKKNNY